MKNFTTTAEAGADRTRLLIAGELDLTTRDDLINAAARALEQTATVLDLDLCGVSFCDSSGLSGVLAVARLAETAGKRVVVSNPGPQVRRTLFISGVLDRLTDRGAGD
jgi:anti-anti-sigma factor